MRAKTITHSNLWFSDLTDYAKLQYTTNCHDNSDRELKIVRAEKPHGQRLLMYKLSPVDSSEIIQDRKIANRLFLHHLLIKCGYSGQTRCCVNVLICPRGVQHRIKKN